MADENRQLNASRQPVHSCAPVAASGPEGASGLCTGPVLVAGSEPIAGYRLVKELGRGGFGQVWEAVGPGGVAVAMKFIELHRPAMEAEVRSIELMRRVHHAHLSGLFGVWHEGGFIAMAMELADCTLMQRLRACVDAGLPGIPLTELLEYCREAAKGIDYLNHTVDLQHCDIKPQNLLLVGGSIKVADFGVVKLLSGATADTNISMTPAYAPPEFLNQRVSRWSDQYSLAITYCQLRANRLPFEGPKLAVLAGHLTREPDLSMLPERERPPVARALAKEPSHRWPTCRDFVAALAATAVESVPPSVNRHTVSSIQVDSTVRLALPPSPVRITRDHAGEARPSISRQPVGGKRLAKLPWVAILLALAGGCLAAILAWRDAWPILAMSACASAGSGLALMWFSRPSRHGPLTASVTEFVTQPSELPLEVTQVSPVNAELLALAAVQGGAAPTAPPAPSAATPPTAKRPTRAVPPTPPAAARTVERPRQPAKTGPVKPPPSGLPKPEPSPPKRSETKSFPVAPEPARPERKAAEPAPRKPAQPTMLNVELPLDALAEANSAPIPASIHRNIAEVKRPSGMQRPALRLMPVEDVALHPGQNLTIDLRLERRHCRGGVELFLQGLPPGILARTPLIPPDTDVGRIELIATLKAVPAETSLRLNAQCSDVTARVSFRLTVRDPNRVKSFTNSIGMKLVLVPPGTFFMGSNAMEEHRDPDEGPQHLVKLTAPFYVGVFPVTQAEYQRVMGENPSFFAPGGAGFADVAGQDTSMFPVEQVSWDQAQAFCARLTEMPGESQSKRRYRLPTEAEWEYACRAGKTTAFAFGDSLPRERVNDGYLHRRPSRVGSYSANAWGLCDVHGNVAEWCQDWYSDQYYAESPETDPHGPATGDLRVIRGGSFADGLWRMRCAARGKADPSIRVNTIGFRVVCSSRSVSSPRIENAS